jgi:hypothetical protein
MLRPADVVAAVVAAGKRPAGDEAVRFEARADGPGAIARRETLREHFANERREAEFEQASQVFDLAIDCLLHASAQGVLGIRRHAG